MEFSNQGVAGETWDTNMSYDEKVKLLEREHSQLTHTLVTVTGIVLTTTFLRRVRIDLIRVLRGMRSWYQQLVVRLHLSTNLVVDTVTTLRLKMRRVM